MARKISSFIFGKEDRITHVEVFFISVRQKRLWHVKCPIFDSVGKRRLTERKEFSDVEDSEDEESDVEKFTFTKGSSINHVIKINALAPPRNHA